jgi:hypothetical protein
MLEKTAQALQNRGAKMQETHGKNFQVKLDNFRTDLVEDINDASKNGAAIGGALLGLAGLTFSLWSQEIPATHVIPTGTAGGIAGAIAGGTIAAPAYLIKNTGELSFSQMPVVAGFAIEKTGDLLDYISN